jgi:hypothetical protein
MEVPRDGQFGASTALLMDSILQDLTSKKIQSIAEGEALRLAAVEFALAHPSAGKEEFYSEAKAGRFYRKELQSGQVGGLALAEALRHAQKQRPPNECTFVDLGSGDGRQVLLASLLQPFARLVGVEILPALHLLAVQSLAKMSKHVKPSLNQDISFHQSDLLDFNWLDADIILITWTCFPVQLRERLMDKAAGLKPGAIAIAVTHEITHPGWTCLESGKRSMSWGVGTVFVYRKSAPLALTITSSSSPASTIDSGQSDATG